LHIIDSMLNVFEALADPTRRAILAQLRDDGALSLSEVAEGLPMTRQAVTKHLDLLRDTGLVRVRRRGRERLHELDPQPLREVDEWLAPYSAFWDESLARLERHLEGNP
jgi:DNA-binding transcriptional ArsR family regulator